MEKGGVSIQVLRFTENGELMRKWIKGFCKELGVETTAEAERLLTRNFEDPGDVYQLLKSLSLSKKGVKLITEEDVKGAKNVSLSPFHYYEIVKRGEKTLASDLKYLLYREEPLAILGALGYRVLQEWHLSKDPAWEPVVAQLLRTDRELKSTGKSPFLLLFQLVEEIRKRGETR
jgi:DNA polymerase III delta subunit